MFVWFAAVREVKFSTRGSNSMVRNCKSNKEIKEKVYSARSARVYSTVCTNFVHSNNKIFISREDVVPTLSFMTYFLFLFVLFLIERNK